MRTQLSELVIDKFVVHDIPSKYSTTYLKKNPDFNNQEPILSDIETPFSDALHRFFHDKLSSSIGSSNSFDIVFKNTNGIVPKQINRYFDNTNTYIEISQKIAKHLYDTQNARNSGGLLLFVLCHIDSMKAIAILKVEREEGVQINKLITEDGHTRFNMQHIENLMLTKNTKLYKIVIFYKKNNETKGILSDQQMGFNIGKEVALYFLNNFLDCDLKEDPAVTTKKYFEVTQQFINDSSLPQEEKAKLLTHLLSTINNNNGAINVQNFAETYLDIEHSDDFLKYVKEKDVPNTSFVKDTALISHKLNKSQFVFDSGILVIAPQNTIESELKFQKVYDDKIKMEITDSLKKVSAK